jgi:hypothetical protein
MDQLKLLALIQSMNMATADSREINRTVKKDIQKAVDEYDLHPRAFNLCASISRMDQIKRLALLRAFDQYRKLLQLDEEPQGELLPEPPTQMRHSNDG